MMQNTTKPKRASTPKQMELFRFNPNGKMEPNTKVRAIRKQVLAIKAKERARLATTRKEETDFIKFVVKEARTAFAETKKRKGYKGLRFVDYLKLQSNYFSHVADGYRASADKEAIQLFEQKAKILSEEMGKILKSEKARGR